MNGLAGAGPGPAGRGFVPDSKRDGVEAVVAVVALLAIAAQLCAPWVERGWLWGADAYLFLPRGTSWWGIGATGALAFLLARRTPGPAEASGRSEATRPSARSLVGSGLLAIFAGACFWLFRIRHVLLGDGIPLTTLLPTTHEIHPREPLASLIQQGFYRALLPVFERPGIPRALVVQECVAVGSVLAGICFVGVARLLAGEIVRTFPARENENGRWLTWGLTLALLAQGYVQMFFGYVENYAYPVVVAALYMAVSLRFLRGDGSILWPIGVAGLGVALDFTGVVLGPSVLVLAGVGLLNGARRSTVVRDLAGVLAITVAVVAWLQAGPLHYPVVSNLVAMLSSGRAIPGYLVSAPHVRDFLNEHLLIGPFGLFLFLAAAASLAFTHRWPRAVVVFLLVAGGSVAGACWMTPDLPMGYSRDWDLFTPLGVVLTSAALALTLALVRGAGARWRSTVVIVAASLFHTIPWIALNASELRSVERFKTLPLGGGRTENTVAAWYAQHGNVPEAKRWLKKSLAINPDNSRALDLYGRIGFDEHDYDLMLKAYLIAVALRPDKDEYREQLAYAVSGAGGPEVGLKQLEALMASHRENGALWLEKAMLLRACGRASESSEARARAIRLQPELSSAVDSLPAVEHREGRR